MLRSGAARAHAFVFAASVTDMRDNQRLITDNYEAHVYDLDPLALLRTVHKTSARRESTTNRRWSSSITDR